jgi:hypothetical protein
MQKKAKVGNLTEFGKRQTKLANASLKLAEILTQHYNKTMKQIFLFLIIFRKFNVCSKKI